jgi:thiamine pyrophosphate-dependent acetolactate synthase large subunit-like protein
MAVRRTGRGNARDHGRRAGFAPALHHDAARAGGGLHIDLQALFKPVTKWNGVIGTPAMIPETVRKAFKLAETEKPGAVHLEIPEEDVAAERVDESAAAADFAWKARPSSCRSCGKRCRAAARPSSTG